MIRNCIYILIGLFFFNLDYKKDNLIYWRENYKLKWEDFKGEPDSTIYTVYNEAPSAVAAVGLSKIKYKNTETIYYEILATFNVNQSFVIEKDTLLLKHEQLHFDIAELQNRILKQSILEVVNFKDLDHQVDRLYEKALQKNDSLNYIYDIQTFSGKVEHKQKQWEIKIKQMLDSLDAYKDIRVCIDLQKCEVYTEKSRFSEN